MARQARGTGSDVTVVTTAPSLSTIKRRLTTAERNVLVKFERNMLNFIKDWWVGWRYKDRPAGAPRLVSREAWTSTTESTQEGAAVIIRNEARDWRNGQAYVAHVHRAGVTHPEWPVAVKLAEDQYLDLLVKELADEMAKTLAAPGPTRKVNRGPRGGGSQTVTRGITI